MFPFIQALQALSAGTWGVFFGNALEWSATIISLIGFYYCILKRPSSFLIFLWADTSWGISGFLSGHWALVVQQILYMGMNVAGYWIWKREEAEEAEWEAAYGQLEQQVKMLSARLAEFELEADEDTEQTGQDKSAALRQLADSSQAVVVVEPSDVLVVLGDAGDGVVPLKTSSAAKAVSTSCLASVRKEASCSPAR
jgi:hypothetical protein